MMSKQYQEGIGENGEGSVGASRQQALQIMPPSQDYKFPLLVWLQLSFPVKSCASRTKQNIAIAKIEFNLKV
jgi:hypothetical protein